MSLAAWYLHKADQCARLAKDAIEPRKRSDFESGWGERIRTCKCCFGDLIEMSTEFAGGE
jgi:hypothetical protein